MVKKKRKDDLMRVVTESLTPVPSGLDTRGLDLDALLALAHEKGYSIDELVRRSTVGRQTLGGVVGNVP